MTSPRSYSQTRALGVAAALAASIAFAASIGARHGSPIFGTVAGILAALILSACLTPWRTVAGRVNVNDFGALTNTILFHEAFTEFWTRLIPVTKLCINVANEVTLDDGTIVLVRSAKPGELVTIKNWKQVFNVYDVGPGGYNSPTDITPQDAQFSLPNQAKAVSAAITPAEFRVISGGVTGGTDYDTFKKKVTTGMLHALGSAIVGDLLATFNNVADFPNKTTVAAGTFSRSTELAIEKKFFDRNVPLDNPQMILSSGSYTEWVDSHTPIQTATGANVQQNLLFMGERQSLTTPFSFSRTNVAIPANFDRGIALQRTGALGAFRIPDEPTWDGDPVSLSRVVDPNTGVGCLVRIWKDGKTGVMQLDIASIWKFQKGQPEAVERLTTA